MKIVYTQAKSALNRSGIVTDGWCLNAYGGCAHACRYCYAVFMKRFYNERAPWGDFVIVKTNVLDLLDAELKRRRPSKVWLSSVTDPYQPIERKWRLTRGAVERLGAHGFHVSVLTKSALVLRDLDMLAKSGAEVGLTVTTDDEATARIMEPRVPSPAARIEALARLGDAGIDTYAFVGPALPMDPARLARQLRKVTGRVLIDKMNYSHRVMALYRTRGWMRHMEPEYFEGVAAAFRAEFGDPNVTVCW